MSIYHSLQTLQKCGKLKKRISINLSKVLEAALPDKEVVRTIKTLVNQMRLADLKLIKATSQIFLQSLQPQTMQVQPEIMGSH